MGLIPSSSLRPAKSDWPCANLPVHDTRLARGFVLVKYEPAGDDEFDGSAWFSTDEEGSHSSPDDEALDVEDLAKYCAEYGSDHSVRSSTIRWVRQQVPIFDKASPSPPRFWLDRFSLRECDTRGTALAEFESLSGLNDTTEAGV